MWVCSFLGVCLSGYVCACCLSVRVFACVFVCLIACAGLLVILSVK